MDPAPAPSAAPTYPRLELHDLFHIARWQHEIAWEPLQDGVEIHRLYGDGRAGPAAALIRFRAGAEVSLHQHPGYEHILVLAGSQRDQNTIAAAGTFMVNPPGTAHRVTSDSGCIVLAIYEKAVTPVGAAISL